MEVLYPCCAGLDVHKETVFACVRRAHGATVEREVRTFGTTTRELLRLLSWLEECGVTHVAMESTGVYWKPVWHVLEEQFELVLANARQVKNVPGRKRDVADAQWIADLLAHGLISSSFVPPAPIQELRDLTRTRKQLSRERTQHVLRLQKVLEDANVKLSSVLSDTLGVSGRAILEAILRGQSDPERLAALADPRVKTPRAKMVEALEGQVREHHRFLLALHLGQIDGLDRAMERLETRIEVALEPFRRTIDHLMSAPGIKAQVAAAIVAEIGVELSSFATDGHLVAWAGLKPGTEESAGKRKNTRTKKQRWLKTMMIQAAWAAVRTKDSYLRAKFFRLRARRGEKKAIVAVAASLLRAVYHMVKNDTGYHDLGADYFQADKDRMARQLQRRLQRLGYEVELRPAAA
jgi:transposase